MADEKKQKKVPTGRVRLERVRGSFMHVDKPSASFEGGDLKFRCNWLMDPTTAEGKKAIKLAEAAVDRVKKEAWGTKADKIQIKPDRMFFCDGDDQTSQEGDVYDGYEGMKVVKSNNAKRPKLYDRDKSRLEPDDDRFYSGGVYNAIVTFYAIKDQKKGGNGIFCTLEGIQYVAKGEAFSGSGISDDAFDEVEGEEDEDDDDDMM